MKSRFFVEGLVLAGATLLVGAVLAFAALHGQVLGAPAGDAGRATAGPAVEFLGHSDGLDGAVYDGAELGGLSALSYDPRRGLYYALVDRRQGSPARFYALRLPVGASGLGEPGVFGATELLDDDGRAFAAGRFDGEGLAFSPWGDLYVASEVEPSVRAFSLEGRLLEELPVPPKFDVVPRGRAQANEAFEGLSMSPDGEALFAATQKALDGDNSVPERRQRVRLLRFEDDQGFGPSGEFFYATEPEGSVSEVLALSATELLVLERTNEVFHVDLAGAEDVSRVGQLSGPGLVPLPKRRVISLDACVPAGDAGATPDVFEGMALGPALPSGGRALVFISDDNFDDAQTTRLAAFGIRPQSLAGWDGRACG